MNRVLSVLLFFMITACVEAPYYADQVDFKGEVWSKDTEAVFNIPVTDSLMVYDFFIHLRNNNDYPFSNIFLITQLDSPKGQRIVDTLEYEMTDSAGRWLGKGVTDIKESSLYFKEDFQFESSGLHRLVIRQSVRRLGEDNVMDPLDGIVSVGISLEEKNNE